MLNNSDVTQQWRNLAADLGYDYKEGEEGLRALFERMGQLQMASFSDSEAAQLEKALDNPLLMTLMGHLFPGAIIGRHRNYEVLISHTINKRGDNSYPAIHIALFLPDPVDLQFSVKSQNFLNGLAERLLRNRYIQLDDPTLDPLVIIQGEDPHQIQLWLTTSRVRQALLDLYTYDKKFEVNQQGIMWHSSNRKTIDATAAHLILDHLANMADALTNTF